MRFAKLRLKRRLRRAVDLRCDPLSRLGGSTNRARTGNCGHAAARCVKHRNSQIWLLSTLRQAPGRATHSNPHASCSRVRQYRRGGCQMRISRSAATGRYVTQANPKRAAEIYFQGERVPGPQGRAVAQAHLRLATRDRAARHDTATCEGNAPSLYIQLARMRAAVAQPVGQVPGSGVALRDLSWVRR